MKSPCSRFGRLVIAVAWLPAALACGSPPPAVARLAMLAPSTSASVDDGACDAPGADDDGDGLADACEQQLADRFAPVVFHSSDESNFPTNVDRFLAGSALGFFDDACAPDLKVELVRAPRQSQLLGHEVEGTCGGGEKVSSGGTRSTRKARTFFLRDVSPAERRGSDDSRDWTTYVHAYPNDVGGITLQYWRFYAYNDALNDHGGDWEGLHVVLSAAREPLGVRVLAHATMRELGPLEIAWEGRHPRVYSEGGGHATRVSSTGIRAKNCGVAEPCMLDENDRATFVRQETWNGGRVLWPSGAATDAGRLLNVGEKRAPLHGQYFVQYSGLWGSPGFLYGTSGYWGPAFNETEMRRDGFLPAWCAGMKGGAGLTSANLMSTGVTSAGVTSVDGRALAEECWPSGRSR